MGAMAPQITSLTIVYSTVYSPADQKQTSKLRITGLCEGNSMLTIEFPAQRASNVENVSIRWHHHDCSKLRHIPEDLYDRPILLRATSRYLIQCWPRSMMPYTFIMQNGFMFIFFVFTIWLLTKRSRPHHIDTMSKLTTISIRGELITC